MGYAIQAKCTSCNFSKEVTFGLVMRSIFLDDFPVPACNKKTGKISTQNIYGKDAKDRYDFYTDSTMYQGSIGNDAIEHGEFSLKCTGNLCPKCKLFTMNFKVYANVD